MVVAAVVSCNTEATSISCGNSRSSTGRGSESIKVDGLSQLG